MAAGNLVCIQVYEFKTALPMAGSLKTFIPSRRPFIA
jgi:hypothetical protein